MLAIFLGLETSWWQCYFTDRYTYKHATWFMLYIGRIYFEINCDLRLYIDGLVQTHGNSSAGNQY